MPMSQQPTYNVPPVTQRGYDRCDWAGRVETLRGRRLILVNSGGSHYDWVAWSELEDDRGSLVIWAVTEEEWWRHRMLALTPGPTRWPAAAAWVEVRTGE